jgi:RNA polymerase sigma-70 factor, ECF subfamily
MDREDFDHSLVQLATDVRSYFRRRVSTATVEDLSQETLMRAFRARDTLREPSRLRAWVYGIAHRILVDHYRSTTVITPFHCGGPHEYVTSHEDVRDVLIASARCYLETLPRTYRDPVYLAEYEGVPHVDVARRLGLSLTATKSRVRRGKIMVRELMEARCEFEYDALGNIIGYQVRCDPGRVDSCK